MNAVAQPIRLMKSYPAGINTVDIAVDLIAACGWSVDQGSLYDAFVTALARKGHSREKLIQGRGYNATTSPAIDQVRSIMKALNLRWFVQDGHFMVDADGDSVALIERATADHVPPPTGEQLRVLLPDLTDSEVGWLAGACQGWTRAVRQTVGAVSITWTTGLVHGVHVRETVGDLSEESVLDPDAITLVDGDITGTEDDLADVVDEIVTEQLAQFMARR